MKKYLSIFVISLKNTLNYRGELAMWGIIDAMPLIGNLILWSMVFTGHDAVANFTKDTIIAYYVLGYIFQQVTGAHFEDHYVKEIINGSISSWLFKPLSLKRSMIVEEMPWRITGSIITLFPIAILMWVMGISAATSISTLQTLSLLAVLALGYFTDAIFSLAIIATGFVFEEARSLMHLKWMFGWLFSGSMIPFEMMPAWLENLSKALPFQARYYLPTMIYTGKMTDARAVYNVAGMMAWSLVLALWIKWYWAQKIKKCTAVGS